MLEAGVKVGLQAETADDAVVMAVDVGVDSVQSLENLLDGRLERGGEGNARVGGEDVGVGEEVGGPGQEMRNVTRSGQTGGLGEVWRVVPEILKLVRGFHLRARLWTAELGDGAVDEIDLVVKVDDWREARKSASQPRPPGGALDTIDGQPLIFIFTLGQPDDLFQTATAQRGLGKLLKLPAVGSLLRSLGLEGAAGAGIGIAAAGHKVSLFVSSINAGARACIAAVRGV